MAAGQAPQQPSTSKQLKSESISPTRQLEMSGASTEYLIPVTNQEPPKPQHSVKSNISHQDPPFKAKFKSKNLDHQQGDGNSNKSTENGLTDVMRKQNEITESLVKQHQAALLPSREIPSFYGDALQYRSFIMTFEQGIERKVDNMQDK